MITYNNKDILKSFIGNNRVVKKYLNNKIVYGTPDFAQYYNIQGYDNYEVVGSPTITDGIVSDFSYDNYFKTSESISTTGISSFEFYSRVKTPTTFSNGWCRICSAGTLGNQGTTAGIYGGNGGTSPYFHLFGRDIWQQILTANTWYRIQYICSETEYTVTIYDDNGNVLKSYTANNPSLNLQGVINFCQRYQNYVLGAIDLNNTYIKVNEKYWFNGNPNYKELFDCNPNVYLQSTGTQYIDTEILPNSNLEFDVKFLTSNTIGSSGYGCIFGGRYNSGNNDLQVTTFRNNQANTSGTFRFGINTTDASQSAGITLNVAIEAHFHNLTYSTNTTNYTVPTYNFTNPRKIFLFGLNGNGTMMQSGRGCKIYYAKFNNSTQRNYFVPVPEGLQIGSYKVPSNGMFDIVTQTFYENKGSGEFIWGVDL